jgi:hypothetical protein
MRSDELFMNGLCLLGRWDWQQVSQCKYSVCLPSGSVLTVESRGDLTEQDIVVTRYVLIGSKGGRHETTVSWPGNPHDKGYEMEKIVRNW